MVLKHNRIVSYYGSEQDDNHLYLYMDFMAGVSQLRCEEDRRSVLVYNLPFCVYRAVCLFDWFCSFLFPRESFNWNPCQIINKLVTPTFTSVNLIAFCYFT